MSLTSPTALNRRGKRARVRARIRENRAKTLAPVPTRRRRGWVLRRRHSLTFWKSVDIMVPHKLSCRPA
jgi:hypothetical protein